MISRKGDDIMKNNIFDLSGQVALVAGGSSGLGLQFAKAMAAIPFSLPLLSGADDSFVAQTFCKSDHFIGIIPAILMQVLSVPAVRVRDSSIPASFNRHIQAASSARKYQRAISRDSFFHVLYHTFLYDAT